MLTLTLLRRLTLLFAIVAIAVAWIGLRRPMATYTIERAFVDGVPIEITIPNTQHAYPTPVVLIAHGFSGSKTLMRGYSAALAYAGYPSASWDFTGHGRSTQALRFSDQRAENLAADLETVYQRIAADRRFDASRIALIGHSMGSGVVLRAGVTQPERYQAVIAVSPTGTDWLAEDRLDAAKIPNLMLQAGQFEAPFVENAEAWLRESGGPTDDFENRMSRTLVVIPSVEHISILFAPRSHNVTIAWLNQVFELDTIQPYTDTRVGWYGLHLVGWLLLFGIARPVLNEYRGESAEAIPLPAFKRSVLGLLTGAVAATGATSLLGQLIDLSAAGGLLVGGSLTIWFAILGVIWTRFTPKLPIPSPQEWLAGLLLFALLWAAFHWMGNRVFLPTPVMPTRLLRWPIMAAMLLPMLLVAGQVQIGAGFGRKLRWWLLQSLLISIGLLGAIVFVPSLGFLILILPLLPLVLGVLTISSGVTRSSWTFAIGGALWFSWTLLSVFPLAAT